MSKAKKGLKEQDSLAMRQVYICPVCGWPGLEDDPIKDPYSEEICLSCRFQFGYSYSKGETFDSWRAKWIDRGMKWSSHVTPEPPDWDPIKQFMNIGIRIRDNER